MKPAAAIIAVLACVLTAPSTALARIYMGVVRYAKPHASALLESTRGFASEAPYLSFVSVAYNRHAGTLVVKYAFYEPSLWNTQHLPNPPEVLLGSACAPAEGLQVLAEPHEFLLEVGQANSTGGSPSRPLGLAHLAGYAGQLQGGSPLSFNGTSYRVEVASRHIRARNWPCLTVAPAAQAGPGGPFSLELDEPVSIRMSAAGKATKPRVHEARVPREQRERREEREEQRTTERQEVRERHEEHVEQRIEERKEHGVETNTERREEEEERREEEEERREELKERQEELAERKVR